MSLNRRILLASPLILAIALAVASAPFAVIADDERATLVRMLNTADALSAAAPAASAGIVQMVASRLAQDSGVHAACDNVTKGDIIRALAAACAAVA